MSVALRIVLIVTTIIYLLYIIKSVKSKKLQLSFSIFWIIMGIIMIVAAVFPHIIDAVSDFLGFEITSNMVFFIAIFIIVYLIFNLTVKISKENDKNRELIQEVSMLKRKVEKLEEAIIKKGEKDERI